MYEALRAGASRFLLKDRPPEELVAAVRVIAAGEALLAPSVTRRLIEEFARRAPTAKRTELDELTEREREVLVLMAKGLSNAEIARALFVAETTVKTHVGRVLHKLGLRDRAQAVVLAYESGLVQPGGDAGLVLPAGGPGGSLHEADGTPPFLPSVTPDATRPEGARRWVPTARRIGRRSNEPRSARRRSRSAA